ncbi:hypothetical protein EDD85DRAFT_355868 [Armillaria nabsnona]|nr:hypothetical protein EDD85DRAFT_355868 [Armillaria nabsnona]
MMISFSVKCCGINVLLLLQSQYGHELHADVPVHFRSQRCFRLGLDLKRTNCGESLRQLSRFYFFTPNINFPESSPCSGSKNTIQLLAIWMRDLSTVQVLLVPVK